MHTTSWIQAWSVILKFICEESQTTPPRVTLLIPAKKVLKMRLWTNFVNKDPYGLCKICYYSSLVCFVNKSQVKWPFILITVKESSPAMLGQTPLVIFLGSDNIVSWNQSFKTRNTFFSKQWVEAPEPVPRNMGKYVRQVITGKVQLYVHSGGSGSFPMNKWSL